MASSLFFSPRRTLGHFIVFWQLLDLANCKNHGRIIRNGNFEDVAGYYPAGVVLKSQDENHESALQHWTVQDGAIEIISSRLWPGSTVNSMYALHLNTPGGPGAAQTRIQSTLNSRATYVLTFDAASPSGAPAVKRLEVSLSSCGVSDSSNDITKFFSFKDFPQGRRLSGHLTWKPIRWVFTFHGTGHCSILRFRSLTPGSRGIILDNIMLSRTTCAGGECAEADVGSSQSSDSTGKSSLELLRERIMIDVGIWFRLWFSRRADW